MREHKSKAASVVQNNPHVLRNSCQPTQRSKADTDSDASPQDSDSESDSDCILVSTGHKLAPKTVSAAHQVPKSGSLPIFVVSREPRLRKGEGLRMQPRFAFARTPLALCSVHLSWQSEVHWSSTAINHRTDH
jgi:hypothetical protein